MKCSLFIRNGILNSFSLCFFTVFITISVPSVYARRYKYTMEMLMDFDYLISQLYVQHCTFVEIGEGICSMFVELPIENKGRSTSEMFFGNCLCSEFSQWQLCSRHLAQQRPSECTFNGSSFTSTSARVHRRLCDVTGMSQWNAQCNCANTLDIFQQEPLCGFRTCFTNPMPRSICKPRPVCGTNHCDISLHGALYAVKCDRKCKGNQAFCERPGPTTSTRPFVTSEWSTWQTTSSLDESNIQGYEAECLNTNNQPAFDCIGPGLMCCGKDDMDCICEVKEEEGMLKAFRYVILLNRRKDEDDCRMIRERSVASTNEDKSEVWNRLLNITSKEVVPESLHTYQQTIEKNLKQSIEPNVVRLFQLATTVETRTLNVVPYQQVFNLINSSREANLTMNSDVQKVNENLQLTPQGGINFNVSNVASERLVTVPVELIDDKNVNTTVGKKFSSVSQENVPVKSAPMNIQTGLKKDGMNTSQLIGKFQDIAQKGLKDEDLVKHSKKLTKLKAQKNHFKVNIEKSNGYELKHNPPESLSKISNLKLGKQNEPLKSTVTPIRGKTLVKYLIQDEKRNSEDNINTENTNNISKINIHNKKNERKAQQNYKNYDINVPKGIENHTRQKSYKSENPTLLSYEKDLKNNKIGRNLSKYHYSTKPNGNYSLNNINGTQENIKSDQLNLMENIEIKYKFTDVQNINENNNGQNIKNVNSGSLEENKCKKTGSATYCESSPTLTATNEDEDQTTESKNKLEATSPKSYAKTISDKTSNRASTIANNADKTNFILNNNIETFPQNNEMQSSFDSLLTLKLKDCTITNQAKQVEGVKKEYVYDEPEPVLKDVNKISIMEEALADLKSISNLPENVIIPTKFENKDKFRDNTHKQSDTYFESNIEKKLEKVERNKKRK